MVRTVDLYWLAGFAEGEAGFGNAGGSDSPVLAIAQVQRQPLERAQSIVGGTISPRKGRGNQQDYFEFRVCGTKAAQVMLTLFVLMSPRRQGQILKCIEKWKKRPARSRSMRERGICLKHGAEPVRRKSTTGEPYCLECNRVNAKAKKERQIEL